MNSKLVLKWTRPINIEYPKIWRTFQARDLNSDNLIDYYIQDLPESKFDEAIDHMISNYIKDEPLTKTLNGSDDDQHIADYVLAWRSMLNQKTVLGCFNESGELVGVNITFVNSKEDEFVKKFYELCESQVTKTLINIISLPYANFDIFRQYEVNEFLGSLGLSVDQKYRGRGIGVHFLEARKALCKEFGLKLTHTIFSSNFSNQSADKVGFKADVAISYDDIVKLHPEWPLAKIPSKELTIKTLLC